MKKIMSVLACLVPLLLFATAISDNPEERPPVAPSDGDARTLPEVYVQDAELAPLQAKVQECLARGDYSGAKMYENQVHAILYARQPQPPVTLTLTEVSAAEFDANPDVVIYNQASRCIGADYEMNGTIWAAAAQNDSAVRVWKSTDHGNTWTFVCGARTTPACLFNRIGLVVGTGDSNFIHVMVIHPSGNGDVYEIRWKYDGTSPVLLPVWVGPDTIIDFTFCRDNTSPYYLYASVNEELRAVGHQNAYMLRSTAFGKDWAVTDSFANCYQSSIQAGAGSWIYFSTFPSPRKGQLNLLCNKLYGTRRQWWERNPRPDTFEVGEPVMAPAFTKPESTAVTWVVYHHSRNGTINYDVLALHSTDGCLTWSSPTTIAGTDDMEAWPDLKNYRSLGNAYMNVSFIRTDTGLTYRRLYRTWVHASQPTNWSIPLQLSDSHAYRSRATKPLLAYSPGSPWTGAGCVFVRFPNQYLVWNAPSATAVAEPNTSFSSAVLNVTPNPARNNATISLQLPVAGQVCLRLYDATGRLVSTLAEGPLPAGNHRFCLPDRQLATGVYLLRLESANTTAGRKLILE